MIRNPKRLLNNTILSVLFLPQVVAALLPNLNSLASIPTKILLDQELLKRGSTTSMKAGGTSFYRRQLPSTCTSLSSAEGQSLFRSSMVHGALKSFFPLMEQFVTQTEPAYCGLSTLVMTLNALSVDPRLTWRGPWRWYEESMLNCCVDLEQVKPRSRKKRTRGCLSVKSCCSVLC